MNFSATFIQNELMSQSSKQSVNQLPQVPQRVQYYPKQVQSEQLERWNHAMEGQIHGQWAHDVDADQ
jgi:hypothetical protein